MNNENLEEVFEKLMNSEGIFEFGYERRLYGFLFEYKGEGRGYITVSGRIPYSLAKKINCDPLNKMRICINGGREDWDLLNQLVHDTGRYLPRKDAIRLIKEGKCDEMYIEYYHIWTIEGVKHVIKCIREYGEINKWAIGNK